MLFFAALVFKSVFSRALESHTKPTKTDFEQGDRGEHKDTEKAENGSAEGTEQTENSLIPAISQTTKGYPESNRRKTATKILRCLR
jgi:hypothetical protein